MKIMLVDDDGVVYDSIDNIEDYDLSISSHQVFLCRDITLMIDTAQAIQKREAKEN